MTKTENIKKALVYVLVVCMLLICGGGGINSLRPA